MTPSRLSREQLRLLRDTVRRGHPLAISAMSLLEIAAVFRTSGARKSVPAAQLLAELGSSDDIHIAPITVAIAAEVAAIRHALRDPGDAAIVATARVLGMRLVTSDQRIIESGLARTVC